MIEGIIIDRAVEIITEITGISRDRAVIINQTTKNVIIILNHQFFPIFFTSFDKKYYELLPDKNNK